MASVDNLDITCTHCERDGEPIRLVIYTTSDETYQFLCGRDDHTVEEGLPIHGRHIWDENPAIVHLREIETDFIAELDEAGRWEVEHVNADD